MEYKCYLMTQEELNKLKQVRDRLYSEKTLTGNNMRDLAHKLGYIMDQLNEYDENELLER